MAILQPREVFRILGSHGVDYVVVGNLGGTLYGSPIVTSDLDVCPSQDERNLTALAAALREMGARIRTADAPALCKCFQDAVKYRKYTTQSITTSISIAATALQAGDDINSLLQRLQIAFHETRSAGPGQVVIR